MLSVEGLMVAAGALIVDEVSIQSEVDTILHKLEPARHERPGEECHEEKAADATHADSIDGMTSDRKPPFGPHPTFGAVYASVRGSGLRTLVSCKIPAMVRRLAYRFVVVLAALALLLPLASVAGSCADCLWGNSRDCCPPSCCPCCVHSPSILTASVWVALHPAPLDAVPNPQENPYPSLHPRDIFHVPKSSLV